MKEFRSFSFGKVSQVMQIAAINIVGLIDVLRFHKETASFVAKNFYRFGVFLHVVSTNQTGNMHHRQEVRVVIIIIIIIFCLGFFGGNS